MFRTTLGSHYLGGERTFFRVWAPKASRVDVRIVDPNERIIPLENLKGDYFQAQVNGVAPGANYFYRLDAGQERPDPASRFQPQGVHGPSQVVNSHFAWEDNCWFGIPLEKYIIYELHVGTFTAEGTFEAMIPHLPELRELGVTALEIMPVAQFPGNRNWGYDGTHPFAVQDSYGGPEGLKRLVNACHLEGLAAILDVVYNHLGPEGNYLGDFGPYFTERYKTPWGPAVNFDGAESDHVRRYFIENALYWVTEFHFDALRLDAVHAILDHSPYPFLEELGDAVHRQARDLNRQIYLFYILQFFIEVRCVLSSALIHLPDFFNLLNPYRREYITHPKIIPWTTRRPEPGTQTFFSGERSRIDSMPRKGPYGIRRLLRIGGDHPPLSGGHVFGGEERKTANTKGPCLLPPVCSTNRFG